MEISINDLMQLIGSKKQSIDYEIPWEVGEKYLFRTVTHYVIGKVTKSYIVGSNVFLNLTDSSWIPDTGRYSDCLKYGLYKDEKSEIEPYPNGCGLNTASLVDFAKWEHELPRDKK